MSFLLIYALILVLGALTYYYFLESKVAVVNSYQDIRSRMKHELHQDINNLIVEYNREELAQKYALNCVLQQIGMSTHLSNRHMDGMQYFIAHLEQILTYQSRCLLVTYNFVVSPLIYQQEFSLVLRKKIIHLIYLLTRNWDNLQSLNINFGLDGGVNIEVENVNSRILESLDEFNIQYESHEDNSILIFFENQNPT